MGANTAVVWEAFAITFYEGSDDRSGSWSSSVRLGILRVVHLELKDNAGSVVERRLLCNVRVGRRAVEATPMHALALLVLSPRLMRIVLFLRPKLARSASEGCPGRGAGAGASSNYSKNTRAPAPPLVRAEQPAAIRGTGLVQAAPGLVARGSA